jgi:hypothetical protein
MPEIKIIVKFTIGQIVYLRCDHEQRPRMVTSYSVDESSVMYMLSGSDGASPHYAIEIDTEKNILMN